MFKKIMSNEVWKGTIILFISINFFNFLNFIFHFVMGRMLGPEDYGNLVVLMSLIYLLSVPTETIQTIISRYTSKFNTENEGGKIKYLLTRSLRKSFKIALLLFILLIGVSLFLSNFLKGISFWLFIFNCIIVFAAFSTPIVRGVLQGRKEFTYFGLSFVFEAILKLGLSILFVFIGLKVFGAILGMLIGVFSSLLLSIYLNKKILKEKKKEVVFNNLYKESIPYWISMLVIYVVLSIDVVLAKRFFSPEVAGQFAVLSMLGKMIFFGTYSIGKSMFPLTSESHDKNKDSTKVFKKSFYAVGVICLLTIAIYLLLPKLVILILYGKEYIEMTPYLFYSGVAFSLLSLTSIIITYNLSINRMKHSYLLFIFLGITLLLLFLFHKSILEYVLALMVSNIIIFIGSLFLLKK